MEQYQEEMAHSRTCPGCVLCRIPEPSKLLDCGCRHICKGHLASVSPEETP